MAAYYAPKEALKSKVGPHHFVCSVRPGRPARPNAVGFRRKAVHTKARRERSTASELSNQGDVHGSEVLDGVSSNIMCGFQVLQFKEMLRNNHMRALLAIIIWPSSSPERLVLWHSEKLKTHGVSCLQSLPRT